MLNNLLHTLSAVIREGEGLLPLAAFFGGFFTSLTPCSLTNLPFIIAYLGNGQGEMDRKKAFKISLLYALGSTITFAIIGVFSAFAGRMISFAGRWIYIPLGLLMILMALQQFGVVDIFSRLLAKGNRFKAGAKGAVGLGIISGIFASPCATPVMIALMIMISSTGSSLVTSLLLFLLYALGHSLLTIIVGTLSGSGMGAGAGGGTIAKVVQSAFGLVFLILGLVLLYQGF